MGTCERAPRPGRPGSSASASHACARSPPNDSTAANIASALDTQCPHGEEPVRNSSAWGSLPVLSVPQLAAMMVYKARTSATADRKRVVSGKGGSVKVIHDGSRHNHKKSTAKVY